MIAAQWNLVRFSDERLAMDMSAAGLGAGRGRLQMAKHLPYMERFNSPQTLDFLQLPTP